MCAGLPAWVVGVPSGCPPKSRYRVSPSGRLLIQLRGNWTCQHYCWTTSTDGLLDDGQTTTCNDDIIPDDFFFVTFESSFSTFDLSREPLYQPTAEALTH